MLDQNTTTFLTTLITVIGTLSGVILGVVLSNRFVARQEKAKRNTAAIEEVYTLLTKIMTSAVENINNERACNDGTTENVNRVATLIHLYIPSLKENHLALNSSLIQLTAEASRAQEFNEPAKVWQIVREAFENFRKTALDITSALEKLVR
jgi:hypothetical protein